MGGDAETINTLYWMWKTLVVAEIGLWVDMFLVTWNCGKRGRTAWIAPSCCTTWYLYTFSQQKLFQLYESWKEYENAMHKNWSLTNYEVPDWLTSELDAISLKQCFFIWAKFHRISTWKKWLRPIQVIFHGKNGRNLPDFQKTISRLSDFYAKFQQVAKNIEGFCIFPTFISRM
jgi:hypothetical protein